MLFMHYDLIFFTEWSEFRFTNLLLLLVVNRFDVSIDYNISIFLLKIVYLFIVI